MEKLKIKSKKSPGRRIKKAKRTRGDIRKQKEKKIKSRVQYPTNWSFREKEQRKWNEKKIQRKNIIS